MGILRFQVLDNGQPAQTWPLRNAYLLGPDHVPLRGTQISFESGLILCRKKDPGTAALVCLHALGDCGELTLSTCQLPERDEPYLLSLELARHRLMLLYNCVEDWGMFTDVEDPPFGPRLDKARHLFIEALCRFPQDPAGADAAARESLALAVALSEDVALTHADLLLNRRKSFAAVPRHPIGLGVFPGPVYESLAAVVLSHADFLVLPTPWARLAPAEGKYRWELLDPWMDWAAQHRLPVLAGPLLSFEAGAIPDWLFMWEHDYEALRELTLEHLQHFLSRYRPAAPSPGAPASVAVPRLWNVISGLQLNDALDLSFDQIMELTRLAVELVHKLDPYSRVLVEIAQPFGEYASQNPRAIPPLTYAELLIQQALPLDGLILPILMGQPLHGQYVRDLMQISYSLDHYGLLGKPLHLLIAAPSEPLTEMMIPLPSPAHSLDIHSGSWRKPWSQLVQSRWLEAMFHLALGKPYVESVAWRHLVDHPQMDLPLSGLMDEEMQPKSALHQLAAFRQMLLTPSPQPTSVPSAARSENTSP